MARRSREILGIDRVDYAFFAMVFFAVIQAFDLPLPNLNNISNSDYLIQMGIHLGLAEAGAFVTKNYLLNKLKKIRRSGRSSVRSRSRGRSTSRSWRRGGKLEMAKKLAIGLPAFLMLVLLLSQFAERNTQYRPHSFLMQKIGVVFNGANQAFASEGTSINGANNSMGSGVQHTVTDSDNFATKFPVSADSSFSYVPNYNTCGLPLGTGFVAPQNLVKYFRGAGFPNAEELADKFSRIAQRESTSDPSAFNNGGLVNGTVDVSAGFFQMNALAHCPQAFTDASGNRGTSGNYDPYNLPISISDGEALKACILPSLFVDEEVMREVNPYLPSGTAPLQLDDERVREQKADQAIRDMIALFSTDGLRPWRVRNGCSIE